jgi:hypothetical protein
LWSSPFENRNSKKLKLQISKFYASKIRGISKPGKFANSAPKNAKSRNHHSGLLLGEIADNENS